MPLILFFTLWETFPVMPRSCKIANEELCLCATSLSHGLVPPSFSKLTYCALQETLKTVHHNLQRGDLLCLRLFPAETVINLHWLSHQAHSTCAPAHLNPTDVSTWGTRRTAVRLMIVVCAFFPPPSFSLKLYCVSILVCLHLDTLLKILPEVNERKKNTSRIRWESVCKKKKKNTLTWFNPESFISSNSELSLQSLIGLGSVWGITLNPHADLSIGPNC